jgi:hypothetical protein
MSEILLVSLVEAGNSLGLAEKTSRNWSSSGKFPVPTFLIGGKRMVRVVDLKSYVDGLGVGATRIENVLPALDFTTSLPKKRGRPRKTKEGRSSKIARNGVEG